MWFNNLMNKLKNLRNKKNKKRKYIHTVAFIALEFKTLPNKNKLSSFLEKEYGIRISVNNWKEDVGTFDIDDKQAVLTLMPYPIDWNELGESYESPLYFDKNRDRLKQHEAYLIVSIFGDINDQLNNNLLLSKIVAGLLYSLPALGVYWGNSKIRRSPEEFMEKMMKLDDNRLPIELWIDIRFRINNAFKEDVYTIGMENVGLKNIEISSSNLDHYILYILIYEMCLTLITKNILLTEGEVIKSSTFFLKVNYTTGCILNNEEVMALNII